MLSGCFLVTVFSRFGYSIGGSVLSSFEVEQSFRNIVRFYSRELYMINSGHKASRFFGEPQRRKLTKIGVFERIYVHQGCRLRLSDEALSVLSSMSLPDV